MNSQTKMRLRVYRSLLGSSYHHSHNTTSTATKSGPGSAGRVNIAATESALLSLQQYHHQYHHHLQQGGESPKTHGKRLDYFDGAVLSLSQLDHIVQAQVPLSPMPMSIASIHNNNTRNNSNGSNGNGNGNSYPTDFNHYRNGFGFMCQLNMNLATTTSYSEWEDYVDHQFNELTQLLQKAQENRSNITVGTSAASTSSTTNNQHQHQRPILDMVIIQAPSQKNLSSSSSSSDPSLSIYEYLSIILPKSAIFLESLPFSLKIGINDRSNIQGKPLGQHVRGISHLFLGDSKKTSDSTCNGKKNYDDYDCNYDYQLNDMEEMVDVFPPTRFVLHTRNFINKNDYEEQEEKDVGNGEGDDHDKFQDVTLPSMKDTYGLPMGLESVVDNTDVLRVSPSTFFIPTTNAIKNNTNNQRHDHYGLFGAGTLFGQVWSVQQLDSAEETYVICDEDEDENKEKDIDKGVHVLRKKDMVQSLSHNVRNAYNASQQWRDEGEQRRNEEMEYIAKENRRKRGNIWMKGQYVPEVAESARIFGLVGDSDDNDSLQDSEEKIILTTDMIRKRWNVLAFQSHPDTNKNVHEETNRTVSTLPSFEELRHHFATLMKAAKQREETEHDKE